MGVYKRGDVFWFKFKFSGETIRESTKQGNQRVAEQIEAARKTQLAKGEVGIEDRKPCPKLSAFAEETFIPFVEKHNANKPKTILFYKQRVARLKTFPRLWDARIDAIQADDISAYVGVRQTLGMAVSTVNRDLATLRRMFSLAVEQKHVTKLLPKVRLLPGENRRERVVSADEEKAYLAAAAPTLRDFAVLEFDCGLRPEEAHRLQWSQIRAGSIEIHLGKTKAARRSVPASPRVMEMLMRRRSAGSSDWVFPAPTVSGHINEDSLKKQHAAAIKTAELEPFVVYSLRHTCLTRWAGSGMDVFTLMKLAGHAEISTTKRYVHMNDDQARQSLERFWASQGGTKGGTAPKARLGGGTNTGTPRKTGMRGSLKVSA
jgi:integrase